VLTAKVTTRAHEQVRGSHNLAALRIEVVRRVLSERRLRIRGSAVLNVGCDNGSLESLFTNWGAIEITGVDSDAQLIETLQASRPEFEYHTADLADAMPDFLHGRTFDLVSVIGVWDACRMDEEATRQMLRNLCSLCRPDGGMLLWTDRHKSRGQRTDLCQISPIIFREFNMSCRVSCPILYLPEQNTCGWGKSTCGDLGWPRLTYGMISGLSRSHKQGGRSWPAGITCHARLAERQADRTTRRAPIHRVGRRGGSIRIEHRRELEKNQERVAPCASGTAVQAVRPDGWRRWIEQDPAVATSGGGGGGRALLISYTFPPTGGSGVQRPAKLVKYLPRFGWNVEVLTAAHERFPWKDESLLADIPPECRVHRVPGYEPACIARHLSEALRRAGRFLPGRLSSSDDAFLGREISWFEDRIYWRLASLADRLGLGNGEPLWIAPAVRAALRRHRRNPFNVVISTGPPHFVHHVARRIARAAGIPWVAELRDPLTSDFERGNAKSPDNQQGCRMEQAIMRQASMVLTTSSMLAEDLRKRYPHRPPESFAVVTNGFDRDDIVKALATGTIREQVRSVQYDVVGNDAHVASDEFLFVAAGSFYGRSELRRLIVPLGQMLERHPQWQGRVRLIVAGTLDTKQRRYWEQHRPEWMTLLGYLDHASAIRLVHSASCAVMMLPECRHSRQCLPGKMFELFAQPTHLLALVPTGSETEHIILDAQASTVAPAEDEERVAAAIEQVVTRHFNGTLSLKRDWFALNRYDRKTLAGAFADSLTSACGKDFSTQTDQSR